MMRVGCPDRHVSTGAGTPIPRARPATGTLLAMGWPELLRRARDRHGVVTLRDASMSDVSADAVRSRAAREAWHCLHRGAWLLPSSPDTGAARHAAAAAVVPGVFCRESALFVLGTHTAAPDPPQLLLPHDLRWRSREGIDVRRTRHLPTEDVVDLGGHRATAVHRCVVDLARGWSIDRLRRLAIDLERDGHLDRADLAACLQRTPMTTPGRGRVRLLLDELGWLRSDSDTEHDIRRGLTDLGYPVHPEPFPYRCDDDVVVDLDLALPAHWVYLEVDGFGTHGRKRGVFETDRRKWTQVVRDWQPIWVTPERWRRDRSEVLRDLDDAIARADRSRPPATPARTTSSAATRR